MKRPGIATADARTAPTAVEQGGIEGVREETGGGNGPSDARRAGAEQRKGWGRRARQRPQAEEMQQIVGERVEQEPKRVGVKGVAREAIGREVALELLDEVLGLPPLVIPGEHVGGAAAPVGDDEADVGALGR